ncbi:MAG: 3-oxoacyl-[Lachnospiraceae bacterium]|nr:3-oxoacyl-[acyl-carrier-protein] reductase [Lachnospiraceae bacterium]
MNLNGKIAVITGGTRGIGYAVAQKLVECGAKLALIAAHGGERAEEAVKNLTDIGAEARLYVCNIANPAEVSETAEKILADFGGVDILVNNAGITRDNLLPALTTDDISEVIDVDLKGAIYVTKAFIRTFVKRKGGSIINISSVVGMMGNKGQTNYAAAKAGIIGFTKSVAKEYGRRNIRCNAIAPGYIATDMTSVLGAEVTEELTKQLPLGRLGKPEDVAELALFLAGDASAYITGEVIKVDGGMYV